MNDWVCGNCKSINRASAKACYSCGGAQAIVAMSEARPFVTAPTSPEGAAGFAALNLGSAAVSGAAGGAIAGGLVGEAPAPPPSTAGPATRANLAGGLVAGIVAAALASSLWYAVVVITNYQVGIVAIAVGFIVGQGVVLGASRRGSVALIAISVVLTLLALVTSEYLVVAHIIGTELAAEGVAIEVVQPIDFVLELVVESIKTDPVTLLFWGIALFQAFAIPARLLGRREG